MLFVTTIIYFQLIAYKLVWLINPGISEQHFDWT